MTALKYVVAAAVLAAPILLGTAPAEAATARQTISQGQGLYTTSQGVPVNFVGSYASQPQGDIANQDSNRVRDFEHHGRYFGGN